MVIITRNEKGSALTRNELDGNFLEVRRAEFSFFASAGADNNEIVWLFPVTRSYAIAANFAGSIARVAVASGNFSGTFDVQKNGVTVGTIVFTNSTPAFTLAGGLTLANGDTLSLLAKGDYAFLHLAVSFVVSKT